MQRVMARTRGIVLFALFLMLIPACTRFGEETEPYPNRPIEVIVPFAPGGGSDTFGRIMKAAIAEQDLLPQPLVIINVPGAGGTVGSRRVMNAKPDGYTVLLLHDAILTAKHSGIALYGAEAFEQVAGTGRSTMVIAVHKDSPYSSLDNLLDAAADKPDTVTFAANLGAPSHFAGLILEQKHGAARFRFAQSGGGVDRFVAIKGEHARTTAFSLEEYLRFRPDGIKALAYLGEKRHDELPQVATAVEQGIEVFQSNMQYWWMPKGSPPQHVERLAIALEQAMLSESVQTQLGSMKIDPLFISGKELQKHLEDTDSILAKVDSGTESPLPNIPFILFGLTLVFGAFVLIQRRRNTTVSQRRMGQPGSGDWGVVGIGMVLILCYAVSTIFLDFPLGISTALFLLTMGFLIAGKSGKTNPRYLSPHIIVSSLVFGALFHVVFTWLFEIGL